MDKISLHIYHELSMTVLFEALTKSFMIILLLSYDTLFNKIPFLGVKYFQLPFHILLLD
jgi:hypothetical protein